MLCLCTALEIRPHSESFPGPPVLFREAPAGSTQGWRGMGSRASGMEGHGQQGFYFSFVVAELTLFTLKTIERNN